MLLTRSRARDAMATISLRGVFSPNDAWLATTDLFRRDADGDYWRVDSVRELIRTAAGAVFTAPIRDALGDVPAVDLAVAYGVADGRGDQVAVAAVTLEPGEKLSAPELTDALAALPRAQRPTVVRVVDRIPVTTWYRPITISLRDQGIPPASVRFPVFYRGPRADAYRPLTTAAHGRLTGAQAGSVSPE